MLGTIRFTPYSCGIKARKSSEIGKALSYKICGLFCFSATKREIRHLSVEGRRKINIYKNYMLKILQTDDNKNYFSTYDLGLSAALISVGFELISLDKQDPHKVLFIFEKKIGIDKAVNDYFSGRLKVSARGLFDNIKMLKNRIYSSL